MDKFNSINISDEEFLLIQSLIYNNFGINLTDKKRYLVNHRLQKLLNETNFKSFKEYYNYLLRDKSLNALSNLVNKLTTNYTFFNREKSHFDFFIQVALPEIVNLLKGKNSKDLRIWCAGCATGEEAYMITILMFEFFGEKYKEWDAGLLATDICSDVLKVAQIGIYSEDKMKLIPKNLRCKYFNNLGNGLWSVKDEIKKEITFRRFNLMHKEFPFKRPFHIIFCRNVMIYFDQPTRDKLVKNFYTYTEPEGYLFIGHSESLNLSQSMYKYVKKSIYKKVV